MRLVRVLAAAVSVLAIGGLGGLTATPASAVEPVPTTVETVQSGIGGIVWSVAFAPDGRYFYSVKQTGEVFQVRPGGTPQRLIDLPSCNDCGEGGLLGLATSPGFGTDGFLYAMYTYRNDSGIFNRVVRLAVDANSATVNATTFDAIPAGTTHNGGRLAFGPDGFLYATMGDGRLEPNRAQDTTSPVGKILRLNPAGGPAAGNPFGNAVFAYGFRNPQGLAFRSDGTLFATEHGPSCRDELNRIVRGGNFGWTGNEGCPPPFPPGSIQPVKVYAETGNSIAPSGANFYNSSAIPQWTGSLFFTTLRDQTLYRVELSSNGQSVVNEEQLFRGEYGRLRSVIEAADGSLWFSTDDGRILRVRSTAEPGPDPVIPELPSLPLTLLLGGGVGALLLGRALRRQPVS